MNDRNRREPQQVRNYTLRHRWKLAVSTTAMIIASAMVLSVGISAYAEDVKIVKDIEDAQAQLAAQTETQSDNESLDNEFGVDAESNTAESSGDGLDFGALADWSRVEEANILNRIVAFVNEDGTHAVRRLHKMARSRLPILMIFRKTVTIGSGESLRLMRRR